MGFQTLESSALIGIHSRCTGGTSSSAKIASTGHSATQRVQSMHSSGSITSMFGPSRKQSTGHTSTQSVYLHFTQDSVTTYVMEAAFERGALSKGDRYYNLWLRLIPLIPVPETNPKPGQPGDILHVTDDTFEQEVLQSETPVLVDYWAE